jgi:hypothetical protein
MFCTICLEDIICPQIKISCNHTFHKFCIDKWFTFCPAHLCPVCRCKINYKYIKMARTRSNTAHKRTHMAIQRIYYLIELFNISSREAEKRRLIKLMLKKIYDNRMVLRINKSFWTELSDFKKKFLEGEEYYQGLLQRWKIKFED